jgi:hypothetical protein
MEGSAGVPELAVNIFTALIGLAGSGEELSR